jgi:hypothetical protein
MAKLVDALCSGRSARKGVLVRIQFWALKRKRNSVSFFIWHYHSIYLIISYFLSVGLSVI